MSMKPRNKKIKIKNSQSFVGKYVVNTYPSGTIKYVKTVIEKNGRKLMKYIVDKNSLLNAKPISSLAYTNKIMSSEGYGVNLILRQMAGITALPIEIDEAVFGTGTTAPTAGDTELETETVSGVAIQDATVTNDELVLDIFVPSMDMPNDLYTEMGLNMAGLLFARSIFSHNKGTNQDTTIVYTITANV